MIPSCDHTGVPIHFHSSTTWGSASLMSARILARVFPRQSPSSAILSEMSFDAGWPWLAPDFVMVSFREVSDLDDGEDERRRYIYVLGYIPVKPCAMERAVQLEPEAQSLEPIQPMPARVSSQSLKPRAERHTANV